MTSSFLCHHILFCVLAFLIAAEDVKKVPPSFSLSSSLPISPAKFSDEMSTTDADVSHNKEQKLHPNREELKETHQFKSRDFLHMRQNHENSQLKHLLKQGINLNIQSDSRGFGNSQQEQCGGTLTAAHGFIQTPHFPEIFPVPLQCTWIIDASELTTGPNVSIVVYLTQMYALSGLKFTEYMYYSDDYKVPSKRVFELTEKDVTQVAWIQFTSQYLEIKFTMNHIDGTHLRALDRLLDVYGFNITYEVDAVKPFRCNVLQCRFLGHCYAEKDFSAYYCSCFPGYSGSDCGQGPLCDDPELNVCENGGTCKHIGDAAVTCICPTGYRGNKCDVPEMEYIDGCTLDVTSHCKQGCQTPKIPSGSKGRRSNETCTCNNVSYTSGRDNKELMPEQFANRRGRTRFEASIRLSSNLTALYRVSSSSIPESLEERLNESQVQNLLEKQLTRALRNYNITKSNDLEIISKFSNGIDVTFHFFGMKNESARFYDAITKLVERGRLGNLTLVSNFLSFHEDPPLDIQSISINKKSPIREDVEFILSCTSEGSISMEFQWFKDGVPVNASIATRKIWTKQFSSDQNSMQTSQLGISKASHLDEGVYTCHVLDWGTQDCKSTIVHVQRAPQLRVDPPSVTLFRGESLRIRCLSPGNDQNRYGHLGYSWTRNGVLFQSDSSKVMWEDLYPDGSILKIRNVQKSAEFTCIVSNSIAPVSQSVYVTVIDRELVGMCRSETLFGVHWPASAPGADILADCPKRFEGQSKRVCEQRDFEKISWLTPDFSHCIADEMLEVYNEFLSLTLGYQRTNCSAVLNSCLEYAMRRHNFYLPGEAGFLLDILDEIEKYLRLVGSGLEQDIASEVILKILDKVMQNAYAVNNQRQVKKLQFLTLSSALKRETIAASQLATSTSSGSSGILRLSSGLNSFGGVSSSGSANPERATSAASSYSSVAFDRLNSFRIYTTSIKTLPFNLQIYGEDLFSDQLYLEVALAPKMMDVMVNSTVFVSIISYRNLTSFLPKTYFSRGSKGADTDFIPASRIIAAWLFQANRSNDNIMEPLNLTYESGHVEIIFQHESRPTDPLWIPVCGHDTKAAHEITWRTDLCITKHLTENITRCICPLSGTFVVLLARKNHVTSFNKTADLPIFVIISCGSCFLQSCITFAVLVPILYNRKCCIAFLKMQFCTSTSTVMAIYILGFMRMLPQDWHGIISSTLASLMLLGLSTLVAILLVVETELVPKNIQMSNPSSGMRGVIGISWLLPTLFGICSPLIYTIIGKWPEHWWLEIESSGFILFLIVDGLLLALFLLMFITLIKKLMYLTKKHDKHNASMCRRIGLVYRCGTIVLMKLVAESLLVIFLNTASQANNLITSHLFGVCCILLGFTILFCFVIKAEYNLRIESARKSSIEDNFCSESINSPLSFYTNHEVEKDNESGQPPLSSHPLPPILSSTEDPRKFPLTILSSSRCSIDTMHASKSDVETYFGLLTDSNLSALECSGKATVGTIIVGDGNSVLGTICDLSLHQKETSMANGRSTETTNNSRIANPEYSASRTSTKSRCCNLGSVNSKSDSNHNGPPVFYNSYKCAPSENHDLIGVETLDILKGVAEDSVIGIRSSNALNEANFGSRLKHNTSVESKVVMNPPSCMKSRTTKLKKRVTIEEPHKTALTSDQNLRPEALAENHSIRQPHQAPPIITITFSGDEDCIGISCLPPTQSISISHSPANKVIDDGGIAHSPASNNSNSTTSTAGDHIDGMLNRISHDLDYLLNRISEVPVNTGSAIWQSDLNCPGVPQIGIETSDKHPSLAEPSDIVREEAEISATQLPITIITNSKLISPHTPPTVGISAEASSYGHTVQEVIIEASEQE